jgi:catechol 2,3-dioxygenase-like lactoylglutathione lyase family enzyme
VQVTGLDHVQVAIPEGGAAAARGFYGGLLGLVEVPKPAALVDRGGCWFVGAGLTLHLGVERPFAPAGKAHLAFAVHDLDAARAELAAAGVPINEDTLDVGFRRFYAQDPFGNRLELVSRGELAPAQGLLGSGGTSRSARTPRGSIAPGWRRLCPNGPTGRWADHPR